MANFNTQQKYRQATLPVLFYFLLVSSYSPIEIRADVPKTQKPEVQHLIAYLKNSGCRMERNGSEHDADVAVEHIQRKYDYYRDEIKTTEDFIERSATRSSLSGRAYHVLCPGKKPRSTGEWLKEELERYRKQRAGS